MYKTDEGEYLWDNPIMIESIATVEAIADPTRLNKLVAFTKRLGKETDQACVMLVFGTHMIYVSDYRGV